MNTILYLCLTLLLLSIMIVIHELGHFLFAKLFKVTVLEFSVGMGPAIFTTRKKKKIKTKNDEGQSNIGDTFYSKDASSKVPTPKRPEGAEENADGKTVFSIRALPIGGYVSMAGEDDASTDKNAFCNKPVWQRFIITIAGPVMNILLGIICMFTLVGMECSENGFLASNIIGDFQEGAISSTCEDPLMVGDQVIKVDGVSVHTGNELIYEILNSGYEPIDLVVIRNGEEITLKGVTFPIKQEAGATIGVYDFKVLKEDVSFGSVMKHAFFRSFSSIKLITDSLKDMLTGRYGAEAVSGPVGMAGAVGDAAKSGAYSLLYLFTLITMNLGVFNLLPLPALDGGRMLFLIIEGIRRKPLKKEIEQSINTAGLMILLALMLLVTLKDVVSLF